MRQYGFLAVVASVLAGSSPPAATLVGRLAGFRELVEHPRLTQVTWHGDVAPIVQRRCAGCHTAGGFGPMPLTRYEDARDWSRAISERAMDGSMPPWPAAPGIGDFSNDRSLTPIEIELLTAWAEGGAAEGTAAAPPPSVTDVTAAAADFVREVMMPTSDTPQVKRFELAIELDAERWITGWAFQPREPARVERAVLGIAGAGRVSSWVPPERLVAFPAGVARRLPPRSTLTVDVFYRKGPRPPAPGGRVLLYFGAASTHQLDHMMLPCGSTVIDQTLDLVAIEPATNASGAMIEAIARRPDRSVEPLLLVRRFVTWHVPNYRLRSAIRLPRGTRVDVRSSAAACALSAEYVAAR